MGKQCTTTIEAPEMSQEEQELLETLLTGIQDQQDWWESTQGLEMAESGYKWQWKEGVDPDYTYEKDPALQKERDDLYNGAQKIKKDLDAAKQGRGRSAGDDAFIASLQSIYDKTMARVNEIDAIFKEGEAGVPRKGDTDYGEWVKMNEEELMENMTEAEREKYLLSKEQTAYSRKAIAGELPLSESLQQQKQKEFEQLQEVYGISGDSLENASGEDTVAIQNLDAFKKRWSQLEEAQRYGQSSSSMEAAVMSSGLTSDLASNKIGQLSTIGSQMGSTIPMYGSLLQPYQSYNMAGYQAAAQNQANQSSQMSSLLGLLGMLGIAASSKDYKKDIKGKSIKEEDQALKKLKGTKSYEYKYKEMMGLGDEKHIGTIAEESPKEFQGLGGKAINVNDKTEFISMALKSLARKVDKLDQKHA